MSNGVRAGRSIVMIGLVLACGVVPVGAAGKGKKKPPAAPTSPAAADLPADPNVASLRVMAMQTLYELDASPEQLRAVRLAAPGLSDGAERAAAKGSDKLASALRDLRDALVGGDDDKRITTARNAVADAASGDDVQLDDAVHPGPAARAKGAVLARTFSAGQLAAYLASHADQVLGPVELLVTTQAELKDAAADEADAAVQQAATEAGWLTAGADPAKAAAVTAKAGAWLRANGAAAVPTTPDARARMESSARAAVGDVPPAEVLGHWFDAEIATLLANPQAAEAAEEVLAPRSK